MTEYEKVLALTIRNIPKEVHDALAIDRVHTGKSMQALVSGLLMARYTPELNAGTVQVVVLPTALHGVLVSFAHHNGTTISQQIVNDLEEMYGGAMK